jgi:hypothetical protein
VTDRVLRGDAGPHELLQIFFASGLYAGSGEPEAAKGLRSHPRAARAKQGRPGADGIGMNFGADGENGVFEGRSGRDIHSQTMSSSKRVGAREPASASRFRSRKRDTGGILCTGNVPWTLESNRLRRLSGGAVMSKRRWQDTANLILGSWLSASPWLLGYLGTTAAWNAYALGSAIVLFALLAAYMPKAWQEVINTLLGVWLVVSPFVLNFSDMSTVALHTVVMGILATAFAIWAMFSDQGFYRRWHGQVRS